MNRGVHRPGLPRLRRLRVAVSHLRLDMRWVLAGLGLGVLAGTVTGLLMLPASWLDWGLSQATQGRVRLAQAQGTVWHGNARIVIVDLRDARLALSELGGRADRVPEQQATLAGLAIPGDFTWDLQPMALMAGRIELDLRHSSQSRSSRITLRISGVAITSGAVNLPSLALERLGSPWNSLRPTANVGLSWEDWQIDARGRAQGRLRIELSEVGSALTPVRPLGSYRGELVSSGERAQVNLSTLAGPLRLEGSGQWSGRSGLRLEAKAWSDPEAFDRLQPLLSLMGRREGDKIIIRIGA